MFGDSRYGHHRGSRVVASDRNHRHRARQGDRVSEHRARLHQLRQHLRQRQLIGPLQSLQSLRTPLAATVVEQAGRGGDGDLRHPPPSQQVAEEVRQQDH